MICRQIGFSLGTASQTVETILTHARHLGGRRDHTRTQWFGQEEAISGAGATLAGLLLVPLLSKIGRGRDPGDTP